MKTLPIEKKRSTTKTREGIRGRAETRRSLHPCSGGIVGMAFATALAAPACVGEGGSIGASTSAVSNGAWVNLGPTASSVEREGTVTLPGVSAGRVTAIVPHPTNTSTWYVAFAGGGVWKTTDGGSSWAAITESLGSLSCGALTMDPTNANVLYLGFGDAFDGTGVGMVKSTDGGATWSTPVYLGSSRAITSIMVAPGDSNVVLATTNAGLFRSTDAGATFSNVPLDTGRAESPMGWSIAWTGGSGFILSLEALSSATTGTTDGQTWWTSNNGAMWTRSTGLTASAGIGRVTVASAPSNRAIVYAIAATPNATSTSDLADIFRSTNGGQSWTALAVTRKKYANGGNGSTSVGALLNGTGRRNQAVIVSPTNANVVYFGGALTNARTSDGGSTFYRVSDWLGSGVGFLHRGAQTAAFDASGALLFGTAGGLGRSTNPAASPPTWSTTINRGLITHQANSVSSSPAAPDAIVGGLQDNGSRVRVGATSTFNSYIGGDGFGSDVHPTNATLVLATQSNGRIYKSTDGGATFTLSCSGITECGTTNAPTATRIVRSESDATGNTVFTFSNTRVYRSTNYAATWSSIRVSALPAGVVIRGLAVARTNGNRLGLVASDGNVYLTSNLGSTWTRAASLPSSAGSLGAITFSTSDTGTLFVASTARSATSSHLWRSTDSGASFIAIDGGGFPFGVPVNVVRCDPASPSTLYAGTHTGAYRSTDAGATWSLLGTGLPNVSVTDFYISSDSTLMRIATFGRGFWELR